jgi:cytochrome c
MEQKMKHLFLFCVLGLTLTTPALYASQDLADKNGCTGCHLMDRKSVGPGIRQIGQKYAGQRDVVAKLFYKVKNGGGGAWHGVWGQVPMPPNPDVSDEDVKAILTWMLEQK